MRLDVRAYAGDDDDDDGSSAADDAAAPPALGCLRNALVGEDIDMVLLSKSVFILVASYLGDMGYGASYLGTYHM